MTMTDLANQRILVVGAGGIGCELLKNLALTGCKKIDIVDLDTIEYSNLNRQFLFYREHVGKSKAEVAASAVKRFVPDAQIKWHHKSIMETEFDVNFFKQFDFVLNALDNRAARNHVNRLCLAADIYLIESGSTGYLGQTTVIKKGVTECYECQPKAPQKTYPACTIRNTPSEPIHCIVWAKHLFNQLFGEVDPDEDVSPDLNDSELHFEEPTSIANIDHVPNGYQNGASDMTTNNRKANGNNRTSTRKWAIENNYNARLLFNKLYADDIKYLLSMTNLWKKRTPPNPLDFDSIERISENDTGATTANAIDDQKLWSLQKYRFVFADCVDKLKSRLANFSDDKILIWDKDDDLAMDFVVACSNLRCAVFNIARKSRFEVKSMAGNIVPAIATTNAIIAGLIVMELLNLSSHRFDDCATTYLLRKPNHKGNYFVKCKLFPPNPKCYVCSEKPEVRVRMNTGQFTVKLLEEKILKQYLNMIAPDVEVDDNKGTIIISSEKDEITGLDNKMLRDLNVGDGTRLNCDDFKQQLELRLIVIHSETLHNDEFEVITDISNLQAMDQPTSSKKALSASDASEDECVLIEDPSLKRKHTEESADMCQKKLRVD